MLEEAAVVRWEYLREEDEEGEVEVEEGAAANEDSISLDRMVDLGALSFSYCICNSLSTIACLIRAIVLS